MPLVVYGPSRLDQYWAGFLSSLADDITLRIEDEGRTNLADLVCLATIQDKDELEIGGIAVRILRNDHPPIEESFALRFDWAGRAVVLSGDTAYMPEMAAFARDADLLVHESMLVEGVDAVIRKTPNGDDRLKQHILRSHTSASDVGRIATAANVKKLALNHFVPDGFPEFTEAHWETATRETWDGPLVIGRDGCVIDV